MSKQTLRSYCFLVAISMLGALAACTAEPVERAPLVETAEPVSDKPLEWYNSPGNVLRQPAEFYGSDEAIRIAETVLLHQSNNGGWPKNYDRIAEITEKRKQELLLAKSRQDTTFDNGSTHSEVRYLAKMYQATEDERYKEAILKGIDFMLEAQYDNGGWPQFYPLELGGYSKYITFNDDAMISVMTVLRDVAEGDEAYAFVDEERRQQAATAVEKGVACILQCQIVVDGQLTAWCAQHDHRTLEPRPARAYEHPSISGGESVGIVRFLMSIEDPSPEVVAAVEGAVAWFEEVKITGIRLETVYDDSLSEGHNLVAVEDETAPPLWARFYEIGTNKPMFMEPDGTIKDTFNELSYPNRIGYKWLVDKPAPMLYEEYPLWKQARQREATARTLRYVIPAVAACIVLCAAAIVGLRWRRRRA
jgi:PelA/Pel-15E family pectate lyase